MLVTGSSSWNYFSHFTLNPFVLTIVCGLLWVECKWGHVIIHLKHFNTLLLWASSPSLAHTNIKSSVGEMETPLLRSYFSSCKSIDSIYGLCHRPVSPHWGANALHQDGKQYSTVCFLWPHSSVILCLSFQYLLLSFCKCWWITVVSHLFALIGRVFIHVSLNMFFIWHFPFSLLSFCFPPFCLPEQNNKDKMFQVFNFSPWLVSPPVSQLCGFSAIH